MHPFRIDDKARSTLREYFQTPDGIAMPDRRPGKRAILKARPIVTN
jgi:hypothetical protein